jgi:hypothetical protein
MPSSSKFSNPTIPKLAQNSDWDDSKRLKREDKYGYHSMMLFSEDSLSKSSPFHTCVSLFVPIWESTRQTVTLIFFQISIVPQELI